MVEAQHLTIDPSGRRLGYREADVDQGRLGTRVGELTQVTVPSGWIVERLDVFRDRGVGDRAIPVDLLLDVLFLQAAEE